MIRLYVLIVGGHIMDAPGRLHGPGVDYVGAQIWIFVDHGRRPAVQVSAWITGDYARPVHG